jgi:Skp family chaperone for outer membrane proteins
MRYLYIITLAVILAGMFVYGDTIPASQRLTHREQPSAQNEEEAYCSEEVEKYQKELDKKQKEIEALNARLKEVGSLKKSLTSYSAK